MSEKELRLATKLIHAGEPSPRIGGAVNLPVFMSSTFEYGGEESYHDIRYIRLNNTPNHKALHAKLAALENAEAALVAASGMAAITTTLLTLLAPGDHLLALDVLYGGTYEFVTHELPRRGVAVDLIPGDGGDEWKRKVRPTTRAIYVETITNPLMQVPDLLAVVRFAREHGLISIVDNTFATPVNFRPAEHGFDLSVHSGTKYLNGHTDIVAGAVIGRADLVQKILHHLNLLGGALDPHACFLLHRGLKTLALRVPHQNESALKLAVFLEERAEVIQVHYPGLAAHPQHARARELFDGGCGGMLSFELAGDQAAMERFQTRLTIPIVAPSLGGPETLVTQPARTSHAGMSAAERRKAGIGDSLIRVSVGLEDPDDLIDDFGQALSDGR